MSDWLTLAAALLAPATAVLLFRATRWETDQPVPPTLTIALAVGIGLGLASGAYFVALVLFGGARVGVIAVDVALVALAIAVARYRAAAPPPLPAQPFSLLERGLAAAVLIAALAAAAAFAANTVAAPHGEWDAWAIWNLRARWLYRAGPAWWTAFTKETIHGDYPVLLPSAVARLWAYRGADPTLVPAALAAAYAGALVLLLYGALAALRGRAQGLLGALCLLGTPLFPSRAAWQYADIPLAYYVLATLVLLALHDRHPDHGRTAMLWAGVAAGLAAWTKNEGLLLLLCLAVVRGGLAATRRQPALVHAGWFLAGLAPFAAVVLCFKLLLAPPSYLVGDQHTAAVLARAADWSRYGAIARAAGVETVRAGGPLLVALGIYIALLGRTRDRAARRAAVGVTLVLACVALGYGAVYVITPADLAWQLAHSLERLILQLWPSALFAFFLYAASPLEVATSRTAVSGRQRPAQAARTNRRQGGV